jgi:hypothetical protein
MSKIFGAILIMVAGGVGLVLAAPAHALDILPGLWQDTVTGEVNGKPIPRKVSTNCVKPAEVKDIVKRAKAGLQKSMKKLTQKCSKLDIRQEGNVVTFEMKCGDAKQGSVDATTVITVQSPRHTTNVAKSTIDFLGQKMVSTITTDSKWIAAACKK